MACIDINAIQKKTHDPYSGYLPFTKEYVEEVEETVQKDSGYGDKRNGGELKHYFENEDHQKNTVSDRDTILHKIMLIDYTYSTNLVKQKTKIDIFKLADKIIEIDDLDKKLENGDVSAVSDILRKIENVNLISFASKYCFNHNRLCYGKDAFSVYDSVVLKAIPYYVEPKNGDFKSFHSSVKSISDYDSFYNLMSKIRELYDAELSSSRFANQKRHLLDHFLWYPNKPNKDEIIIKKLLKGSRSHVSKPIISSSVTQFWIEGDNAAIIKKLSQNEDELKKKLEAEKVRLVMSTARPDLVGIEIQKEQKTDGIILRSILASKPWNEF